MPTPQPEIVARALTKRFGPRTVLDSVDLTVNRGEVVAIVGGSGSGKTVLLDCLTGLMEISSGAVEVADHSRSGCPLVELAGLDEDARDEVRMHWAVVFQRNALHSGTVEENVSLWLREHTDLSADRIDERVRRALSAAALDVNDVLRKDRDELSGGMAKRVAIARAIAIDPVVIFYDEPTTGLDPVVAGHIHELIWEVHHRPRADGVARTTVIVTHDRDLLRRLHPRVVMLHAARVCFDGAYEAFASSLNPLAQEYLSAMPVLQARNI